MRTIQNVCIFMLLLGSCCGDTPVEPVVEDTVLYVFPSSILCEEDEVWVSNPFRTSSSDSLRFRHEYVFFLRGEDVAYSYRFVSETGEIVSVSAGVLQYCRAAWIEDSYGRRMLEHQMVFVEETPVPDPFEACYPMTMVVESNTVMILKGTFFFKLTERSDAGTED